jgi:hypothetical protein
VRKVAPIKAETQFSIIKPFTNTEASFRIMAFKTKEKSPKVRMVIGRVRKKSIGAIEMLRRPMIIEAQKAFLNLSICIPGTILEIIIKPTDEISDVSDQTSI